MAPPTGPTVCLSLTLSIHLQVSCQSHCALTNSPTYTNNGAEKVCKGLLQPVLPTPRGKIVEIFKPKSNHCL